MNLREQWRRLDSGMKALVGGLAILAVWGSVLLTLRAKIEHMGQLGDAFAPVTSIFALIAAVGAWRSYAAQREQLRQAERSNGPVVYVDLEIEQGDARLVIGNAGNSPATNVKLTIQEHLPWRKKDARGFNELPIAKDGISYLAPRRVLKYSVGWLDSKKLFDGTDWFLDVQYAFVNHVGEHVNGSFRVGHQQYSNLLFDSFRKPTHGIADAIRELARAQLDDSRMTIRDMLASHCPTCGEKVSHKAKKCPHCWELIQRPPTPADDQAQAE